LPKSEALSHENDIASVDLSHALGSRAIYRQPRDEADVGVALFRANADDQIA
jgi:hypothetical protein